MVAYGFKAAFVDDIKARRKRQTIRLPRKRHARPGEPVQLYVGLRTRYCRKIIPDPVCVGVDEVRIDLRDAQAPGVAGSATIEVNGIPLVGAALDDYARGDGFNGSRFVCPAEHMLRWWLYVHGRMLFDGVAIRWEDRP